MIDRGTCLLDELSTPPQPPRRGPFPYVGLSLTKLMAAQDLQVTDSLSDDVLRALPKGKGEDDRRV